MPLRPGLLIQALLVLTGYVFLGGPAAVAETITVCRGSIGKTYLSSPDKGWIDDGIKKHTMIFQREGQNDYDVVSKDEYRTFSAKDEGAVIIPTHRGNLGDVTLVLVHPVKTVEVYQLSLNREGYGTLIWSNMKNSAPPAGITKGSMFTAYCTPK